MEWDSGFLHISNERWSQKEVNEDIRRLTCTYSSVMKAKAGIIKIILPRRNLSLLCLKDIVDI